jgi:hypothetical protein
VSDELLSESPRTWSPRSLPSGRLSRFWVLFRGYLGVANRPLQGGQNPRLEREF